MSALLYLVTFALGLILGAGAMLIYFQYTMYRQAGKMQEQFEQIQELQQDEMSIDPQAGESDQLEASNGNEDEE